MNKVKRNAVILTVILFVGAAIYLNWSYGQKGQEVNADGTGGLYYENEISTAEEFANIRLNREQARSEASKTLQTVSGTEGIPQETIDAAAEEMLKIADWTVREAEIESMIVAKGFDDCVVFMTDDGITVTVAEPEGGLDSAGVAKIKDIITTETEYAADDLKIMEIK